jgi:hypothetical protein
MVNSHPCSCVLRSDTSVKIELCSFDIPSDDLCDDHRIFGKDDPWAFSIYSFIALSDIASHPPPVPKSSLFIDPACILFPRPLFSLFGDPLSLISPDPAPPIPLVSLACHLLHHRHHCCHILHHRDLGFLYLGHALVDRANPLDDRIGPSFR